MDDCNRSGVPRPNEGLQRILIKEINASHDVVLDAGGKVVGVPANGLRPGVRLELQNFTGAAGQVWAFDGDTLLLRASRNLVAEVHFGLIHVEGLVWRKRLLDAAPIGRNRARRGRGYRVVRRSTGCRCAGLGRVPVVRR
jgi:hypothetical protein